MSSENPSAPHEQQPLANVDLPAPRKKRFLTCGCLGLLLLLGIGGFVFWNQVYQPFNDFLNENLEEVRESDQAAELIGIPMETGTPKPVAAGDTMTVRVPMSGPNGSGTMVLVGKREAGNWVKDELFLEVEGQRHDIEEFELEIDLGDF